jgi:soluble lytic murein transglycosylase-like protein
MRASLFIAIAVAFIGVGAYRLTVSEVIFLPPMEAKTARKVAAYSQASKPGSVMKVAATWCLNPSQERVLHETALLHGIHPNLLLAIIYVESRCNAKALSPRGAVGLMQILPSTARELGFDNPHHPGENIRAGGAYLKHLQKRFGGDFGLLLAAYNAGPGAVRRHGGVPPFAETKSYIRLVMKKFDELNRRSTEI